MLDPRREAALVWIASLAVTALLGVAGQAIPWVGENLLGFVAAMFLYLPAWAVWRRGLDLGVYGLTVRPLGRGLTHLALTTVLVLPPFVGAYHLWHTRMSAATPTWRADRLVRFPQELDGRPTTLPDPPEEGATWVWIEGDRISVLTLGGRHTRTELRVGGGPLRGLAGLSANGGQLTGRSLVGLTVSSDRVAFEGTGPAGFSASLDGVERLEVSGAEAIFQGRYGVRTTTPLDASRSAWWWLWMIATQLILVAVPEEWFFRGYLQQRLDQAFGRPWRVLGADLGWGWLLASVMFAIGHLVLDPRPARLAVFFPSLLFGWLLSRTRSILAPAGFHALCNVLSQALAYVYFG